MDIVHRTLRDKDAYFCNARWIKQFVESGILPAMARRVMQMPKVAINASVATAIEAVDVQIAARKYASRKPMVQMKPRIGFVA